MSKSYTRRSFLRFAALGASGALLAACQPKIVEVTKIVKEVVKETVQVEKEKVVEKEVTKVVEKQVPAPQGPITLIIMHVHPAYDAFGQKTADPKFEELHANVKIKRELVPGWIAEFYPKLITMHAAGTPWDVAQLPHSGILYAMYSKGVFKDLSPLVEVGQFKLEQFVPASVEGGKNPSGAFFMMPILIDNGDSLIVWNKDLLDKAGVSEPTPEWRFDSDFRGALQKLKGKLAKDEYTTHEVWANNLYGAEAVLANSSLRCLDDTGRKWQLGDGKGKACLKLWADMAKEGLVPKAGEMPAGAGDIFNSGKMAFLQTFLPVYIWYKGVVKDTFKVGTTYMPKGPEPDGVTSGIANLHFMGLSADSKNIEMGWEYLKFFTGTEMAQPLWDAGLMPARIDTWQKNANLPGADAAYKLALDVYPKIRPPCQAWNFRTQELWDAYTNVSGKIWLGQVDFDQGIDETAKAVDEVLNKPMA